MNKIMYLLIALSFVIGITIGSSSNVIAQSASIPSWIKNNALWWGQGQISDGEFIKAIQWLIEQKILVVPQSNQANTVQSQTQQNLPEGFSGTSCQRDVISNNIVHMTGKFTNGPTHYSEIFFTSGVLDKTGNVLATGSAAVYDIAPFETKTFDAAAFYSGDYSKCTIEIDQKVP